MAWKAGSAAALRSQKEKAQKNSPAGTGTVQAQTSTSSTGTGGWTKGSAAALRAQKQTEAANADTMAKAFDEYRENNNLNFADEVDQQSDWLSGKSSQAAQSTANSAKAGAISGVQPEASAVQPSSRVEALSAAAKYGVPLRTNVLEQTGSGAAAYGDSLAQKLKASYAPYSQKDTFDRLNEWFDTDDNRNLADAVRRVDSTHGAYTDADLIKNGGWTQAQIDEARQKNAEYDALPAWKKTARRTGNTIGGIADSVAGGAVMTGETGVQSAKNIAATQQNWAKVQQEIKGDARAEKLFQLLTDVDMDYNPVYPESRNRDLVLMGYGSEEIRNMRDRLAGLEVNDSVDPESSVGYQLYKRGQDLTEAAQSGLSDGSRAVQGAVSSAAENLAVSAINPAAVLPVLSLQGAGDAMGQSMEKGESAGKTLAGGALKFGAGWAINSVGAADLAKTMGSDYAKDTIAGQIADWVRGMAGDSAFAQQYPAIANAVTGGIDNAMQAFVETYADTAIDAALGDTDAAKDLFTKEHLLNALESGLSGGASGALGGAVGTGLAKYNDGDASLRGNVEYYDQVDRYEKEAAAEEARQKRVETPSVTFGDSSLGEGAFEEKPGVKYSIQTDYDGNKYVQIDDDLLKSVPEENWKNTVRDAIRDLFPNGFERDGQRIDNTREGRGEFTHSKYTRGLERTDSSAYADKMRMSSNLDEVISTSSSVENEPANHKNAESFNRGKINIRIGSNDYNADVLTAVKQDGREVFYDVVNIQPTTIKAPTETADTEVFGNRSMGADEATRRTDAESVESDGRGQPETSNASIAPESAGVNGRGVEKAGETVESAGSETENTPHQSAAQTASPQGEAIGTTGSEESGPMRETYGLREQQNLSARQHEVQRQLEQWGVVQNEKTKAAQDISEKLPAHVDADRYAAAASTIYRLAQMDEVKSFDDALRLAGAMDNTALNVNYVLDSGNEGRLALNTAYLYGADTKEAAAGYGGKLTDQSTSGQGQVYYEGTLDHDGTDMGSRLIELNAAATGTDAVLKNVLQNDANVRAYVDTETARIFFGDSASDLFGTILHENYHWYNSLDSEGAKSLQDHALTYLAQMDGYESVDEMIRDKMGTYASQKLTYAQAAEELAADAWRGIFSTEADFKRWVEFQREQAEKNAGMKGSIHKVMNRVKELLSDIISRAKEVLAIDPDNAAARKAKRLAEAQKRALQDEYFAHAEKAMDTLRSAKENAAALKNEGAAEKTKNRTSHDAYLKSDDNRGSLWESSKEPSGGTHVESEDSRSRLPEGLKEDTSTQLPKAVLSSVSETQEVSSDNRIAQDSAESKRTDEPVKKSVRMQLDESFEKNVDAIDLNATWSKRIRVGTTSEVLKNIGVKDQNVYWDSGKIRKILKKHSAENFRAGVDDSIMTKDIIKQVPQVLENPIVVLHSDVSRNANYASRIYMFGEVYDQTGKPVDVSLELLPTSHQGVELDNIVVTSAYGKKNIQGLLNRDEILYIDPNKNRTDTWLAVNRLQLPLRITRYGSISSLRYEDGNVKAEGTKNDVRFQMAEQADRDAKRNRQRQASRAIADNSAAIQTLVEMMGLTRGVRVSDDSILGVAERLVKASGAKGKADTDRVAREMRTLIEYMKTEGADMNKAQGLAETIAGEILDSATYRNTELWQQYPEYHELSYTVDKNGKAKAELVRQYGSWGEAVAEARKHGVKLRQEEGHRDGNPAEEYEAIVNDTRSMGGVKQGAAELFHTAAKAAGVDGTASMESTEWLDVLMNVHDAIKPRMMSRFADVAEYEDAKVELAGRMIGDLLHVNEMNDAQAIFDSFQQWQRRAAAAAAGDEASAAQAVKDLKAVQKEQTREFNRRLAENQKAGNQSEAVQQIREQQRQNAKAERLLDANLDALGVDITNSGDMAEKLDVLKEAYEREWEAERKRLREERQQMLDEITLENRKLKAERNDLARQVAGEQRRADRAERQLMIQENEVMEWEAENQRKAEAWQQKQAQKNAIAVEVARQQRDEDIAVAKALAEKRVQRARDGRQKDELKRSIRNHAAQLNQMILRPSKGKYVQPRLIQQAAEVAKLADQTILNDKAVAKLTALANTIHQTQGTATDPSSIAYDWEQTGVPKLIQALQADMMNSKQAQLDRLHTQLTEAEALGDGEKAEMLRDRLRARIRETENRTYLPMTVDQLRMLKAITAGTLHVIRTENKTLSLAKTEEVDAFAQKAGQEVLAAKGNEAGRLRDFATKYNLDMLGGVRVFRMLGGYTKNGQMEKLATMLNDGQRRQTEITVEGTKLFDDVTGKANLKQMKRFAGPGAELVDIGLKDTKGHAVPLTHAQLCSLYMHLQNADSREHLLNGGLTLPDAELYNKGDIERAYQRGQTVQIGNLVDSNGAPMADTILNTVENVLTDYDRAWIADMKNFFGSYTTNLINETSMKLVGFARATVKNYYPIAVDKTQLASEIEGLKLDATIEGRGFLKERVKSSKPILLEECSSVVQRSLRDTAAYAGLAAPIRDANRILNADVETRDGIGKLKNGILKEHWGQDTVNYVDYLLTDLQSKQRKRSDGIGRAMGKLRGNYAGAILTLNPGVAIAQAASLPTAGAVLGSDTLAAVLPFVKNLSGKQRAALEAEISAHGDALLQYRMRGSQRGELASIGVSQGMAEKAMDALPKGLTGWINGMDEITVAALWEGAKHYVEHHAAEFNLSVASGDSSPNKGSPWQDGGAVLDEQSPIGRKRAGSAAKVKQDEAYWKAVNQMYQRVIEETQPNYTVMQRAGIQRSDNEITKTLTMFTTQRFQNYGILADAVMDYNAQKARYKAEKSAENKAEVQRAGKSLRRAASSQVMQTAVFALMKIGADFLLHRWDREQDENGDVTAESLWKRFAGLFTESAAGNFLFGSELYSAVGNAVNGTDYDVVSATNISAVNDLFAATTKLYTLIRKDATGMDEEELAAYHQKLRKAGVDVMEYGLDIAGIPAANARKMVDAFAGYADDVQSLVNGEVFSLNGVPSSATGQYDRLFNAIQSGDTEEAQAALDKLAQMGKSDKVNSELKKRLKNYDPDIETAAKARNVGKDSARQKATIACIRNLYETLGIREGVKADAAKREAIIDLVTSAVDQKADELLAGDKDRGIYEDLTDALEVGRVKDVQSEVDRLLKAGKSEDAIKTKITGVVKSEYLAGSDHDREKLADKLLKLKTGDEPLYEEKTFDDWVKQDEKKQEAASGTVDEWASVR